MAEGMAHFVGHVVDASSCAPQTEEMTARRIVFAIFEGLQPIDLVGPREVFSYPLKETP
jgi:hypothetical protein